MDGKNALPVRQKRNFGALSKCQRESAALQRKLETVVKRRIYVISRIFDEIEKNPSIYFHVVNRGKQREARKMTARLVRKLRSQFNHQVLRQQQAPKNPHGGP